MDHELATLQAVRHKGRIDLDALLAGRPLEVGPVVTALVDGGMLKETPRGLAITPEGRARADELLAAERDSLDKAEMTSIYEAFCELDADCKVIVTSWQLTDASAGVINDHSDPDYDRGVVDRLLALHQRSVPLLARIAAACPRLAGHGTRLDAAAQRVADGDHTYIAAPMIDSFHTVWFELHEELIGADGRTRADEAAAGRA